MAKHQQKRGKRKTHNISSQSQSKQKLKSTSSSEMNHLRPSTNHPYSTRSKTLTNSLSMTCFNIPKKRKKFRRRLSDSSIICLGTYRKIPPFIDLEDTTEYLQQTIYEKLDG